MKSNHCFWSLLVTRQWLFFDFEIIIESKLNSWHWKISKLRLHDQIRYQINPQEIFQPWKFKLKSQTFKVLHLPKYLTKRDSKIDYFAVYFYTILLFVFILYWKFREISRPQFLDIVHYSVWWISHFLHCSFNIFFIFFAILI